MKKGILYKMNFVCFTSWSWMLKNGDVQEQRTFPIREWDRGDFNKIIDEGDAGY